MQWNRKALSLLLSPKRQKALINSRFISFHGFTAPRGFISVKKTTSSFKSRPDLYGGHQIPEGMTPAARKHWCQHTLMPSWRTALLGLQW